MIFIFIVLNVYLAGVYQNPRAKQLDRLGRDLPCCLRQLLLVDSLCSNVKLSWKLSSITKSDNGGYSLTYETPEGTISLQSRSVVMTIPSHVASNLLHPLSTEGEFVDAVDRDLRTMFINPNAKHPFVLGVRVWSKALPQFLVGHLDLLDTAKTALWDSGFHGLFLGGNYASGVALGRCVEGTLRGRS